MNGTKEEILKALVKSIKKTYGDESIGLLGDNAVENVDVISTGSLALDIAIGVGGVPRGRVTEIYRT